jgi:TonB family protein
MNMRVFVAAAVLLFAASLPVSAQVAPSNQSCNAMLSVVKAQPPVYPPAAAGLGLGNLEVLVEVQVDAAGGVTGTKIVQSSGYDVIDAAAIASAEGTTYRPAMRNCVPVPMRALFKVVFRAPNFGSHDLVTPPTFTAPDGWMADPRPASPGELDAWMHGNERLVVVGKATADGESSAQSALNATLRTLRVEPSNATVKTQRVCGAPQPGARAGFIRTLPGGERRRELLLVAQGDGNTYEVRYSVPADTPFDPRVLAAIDAFCIQGGA